MIINCRNQLGVTLIEMMIAMLLGLFVSAAAITVFITSFSANSDAIELMQMNQELRASSMMMSRDIRRHGYTTGDVTANNYASNILIGTTDISALAATSTATSVVTGSCLWIAYDEGSARRGYRVQGDEVQYLNEALGGTSTCASGNWQPLTDSNIANIDVANSSFTATKFSNSVISIIDIEIDLVATSSSGDFTRNLTTTARVRNDSAN